MNKAMINSKRRLDAVFSVINSIPGEYDIYSMSISEGSVSVQGYFNSDLVVGLMARKFEFDGLTGSGFVELRRGRVRVVLT